MGVTDAPQWLLSAFVRSARAVGATVDREELEDCARRLISRWQEPERTFHNLRHVIDVLARVDELAEETHHPDVVRLAAWYHGAVFNSAAAIAYARRGGEDEEASAALARDELAALGIPEKVTGRVATLIRNLKRHDADPADADCLALSDADLATLAVEPQRYAAYRAAVRAEYAHLPLRDYLEARVAIITKLLARRRLYGSPFGAMWEEPARENLSAELQRLKAELAKLCAGDADGGAGSAADAGAVGSGARAADDGAAAQVRCVPVRAATRPDRPAGQTTSSQPRRGAQDARPADDDSRGPRPGARSFAPDGTSRTRPTIVVHPRATPTAGSAGSTPSAPSAPSAPETTDGRLAPASTGEFVPPSGASAPSAATPAEAASAADAPADESVPRPAPGRPVEPARAVARGAGTQGGSAGRAAAGAQADGEERADTTERAQRARGDSGGDGPGTGTTDARAPEDDASAAAEDDADGYAEDDAVGETSARPVHGIEREPEPVRPPRRGSERRGWRGRRGEKDAASRTPAPDDVDSTGSLFRPPPTLPRS
ncbi:HD domain-containing protein [Georgenia wangjunii]|uniref:HD domain-containing protein n=1 Tax=Georgenia wangjunii TaxID=3117730 RepID=UPI002F2601CE